MSIAGLLLNVNLPYKGRAIPWHWIQALDVNCEVWNHLICTQLIGLLSWLVGVSLCVNPHKWRMSLHAAFYNILESLLHYLCLTKGWASNLVVTLHCSLYNIFLMCCSHKCTSSETRPYDSKSEFSNPWQCIALRDITGTVVRLVFLWRILGESSSFITYIFSSVIFHYFTIRYTFSLFGISVLLFQVCFFSYFFVHQRLREYLWCVFEMFYWVQELMH